MHVERHDQSGRYAQAVRAGEMITLAGQVADDWDAGVETQIAQVLDRIDRLLEQSGSHRSRLVSMMVWLPDLADYATFNRLYDGWIDPHAKPARATVQAQLIDPRLRIEILVTAASAPRTPSVQETVARAQARVPALSVIEVEALRAAEAVVLVDVREPDERAAQSIPGSVAVPRGWLEFALDPDETPTIDALAGDRRLVFVCGGGGRAALAAVVALEMGRDAAYLIGGIRAWTAAAKPQGA